MKYTLGIDPGTHGALALYDGEATVSTTDMPTFAITVGRKKIKRLIIDLYELGRFFDLYAGSIEKAIVEDVNSQPNDGAIQAFKFGFNCGTVQAMVAAHFIPMTLVRPNVWKRAMGLTSDKDASRRKASMLLPKCAGQWSRVKDDGRAEAALLAVYGSANPLSEVNHAR